MPLTISICPWARCLFPKGDHETQLWWKTGMLTFKLINPDLEQILGKCYNEPAKHVVYRGNNKKKKVAKQILLQNPCPGTPNLQQYLAYPTRKGTSGFIFHPTLPLLPSILKPHSNMLHVSQTDCRPGGCGGEAGK